jgi:hypothetical protein
MIEGTAMVPLIDVRDWMRNAGGINVAPNTQTRMEPAAWVPWLPKISPDTDTQRITTMDKS